MGEVCSFKNNKININKDNDNIVITVCCKHCQKPLGKNSIIFYMKAFMGDLVDGGRKAFCDEQCYNKYLKRYFVEEYKGNKIYWILVDGTKQYIPYVGCSYCFKSVEELKRYLDERIANIEENKLKFKRFGSNKNFQ